MATNFFGPKYITGFDSFILNTGIFTDVANFFAKIKAKREKYAAEKRIYCELQALSNRELDDIGLRRSDITAVSKGLFVR